VLFVSFRCCLFHFDVVCSISMLFVPFRCCLFHFDVVCFISALFVSFRCGCFSVLFVSFLFVLPLASIVVGPNSNFVKVLAEFALLDLSLVSSSRVRSVGHFNRIQCSGGFQHHSHHITRDYYTFCSPVHVVLLGKDVTRASSSGDKNLLRQ
jgi:hypothetical protein